MAERMITVTQLNLLLKRIVDAEDLLKNIQITGEVSNFTLSGGHAYFTLKDEESQLRCTFFNAGRSSRAYIPKAGEKVVATGSPSYYVKGGQLSFNVTELKPMGLGALFEKYMKLKGELEKEGIFDPTHKKPIPTFPRRIGVVTSKTGAVIRDIINVTRRRNPFVDIVLYPVKVQGEGADIEIAKGVARLDESGLCDTIIVGRGGGSLEDLEAFYMERVVRAVYACKTPIISAVGHETDFSLCDFAADLRAPTPSAAAELAVPDLKKAVRDHVALVRAVAQKCEAKYTAGSSNLIHAGSKLALAAKSVLVRGESQIKGDAERLWNAIYALCVEKQNGLKLMMQQIKNLNPMALLEKGYAKASFDGKEIGSVEEVRVGENVSVRMWDGSFDATVTEVVRDHKEERK